MDEQLIITADNYAAYAERTEKAPTGTVVLDPPTTRALHMALMMSVSLSGKIDTLKRGIIYGKPTNMFEVADALARQQSFSDQACVHEMHLTPEQFRLLHAAVGMLTEAAEFAESVMNNVFHGEKLDSVHLREEVGDQMWYQAIVMNVFDWTWASVMQVNIDKLRKRYPDGFTSEKALNRDLAEERRVLEGQ